MGVVVAAMQFWRMLRGGGVDGTSLLGARRLSQLVRIQ